MAHAAQDCELVGNLGKVRKVLADLHARHIGVDRVELAAVFGGSIGLEVEGVHVARSTTEADEDGGFAACCRNFSGTGHRQIAREGHSDAGQRPNAQEIAAIDSVTI